MELPLFPLRLVLFPGRPLQLHVFELRYRELLRACLDADRRFGVVAIRSGIEVGPTPEVFGVGTIAEIQQVEPLEDGRANLLTRGTERFRVDELVPGAPYLRARVTLLRDRPLQPSDHAQATSLRNLLVPYLASLGAPRELLERLPSSTAEVGWLAAAALQVDLGAQQRLLELDDCSQRLTVTCEMLRREAHLMRHFGSVGSLRPPGPVGAELN